MFFYSFFRKNQNPDKCRKTRDEIEIQYIQVIWFLESHGCQELQGVTEEHSGLQRVKKDYKGYKGLQAKERDSNHGLTPLMAF